LIWHPALHHIASEIRPNCFFASSPVRQFAFSDASGSFFETELSRPAILSAAASPDQCANLLGNSPHRKVFFVGLHFSTTDAIGDAGGSFFETVLSRPVISSAAEDGLPKDFFARLYFIQRGAFSRTISW
jgi:hypothetical protein